MKKVSDILDTTAAEPPPPPATRQDTCHCGKAFTARWVDLLGVYFPDECAACDDFNVAARRAEVTRRDAEQDRIRTLNRKARILAMIPPAFQDTDRLHPSMQNPRVIEAMKWDFGPQGLLVHGQTGGGKSRACYLIAQREAELGKNVLIFPPAEFSRQMAESFRQGREERFHRQLKDADLVFLDDLGKEKMTLRVQEELFALVDYRITHRKPILITTNFVGDKLIRRFEDVEAAIPLVERFRTHFKIIHVLPFDTDSKGSK